MVANQEKRKVRELSQGRKIEWKLIRAMKYFNTYF
jgi:hypothetical protein